MSPSAVARASLQAYVDKDRAAIEALVAPDFHFTSPLDNRIDRAAYFEICWPNSANMAGCTVIETQEDGETAFIVYEGEAVGGKRFRNVERHRVRGGQLVEVEVYFGWTLPHPVAAGAHKDPGQAD